MAKVTKRTWKTGKGESRKAFAVDFSDSNGDRQRRQFKTKAEADAFRVETEGQLRGGTFRPDAAKTTVQMAADIYVAHITERCERKERMTPRNLKNVKGRIGNYICPDPSRPKGVRRATPFTEGLASVKLAKLLPSLVDDFRDRLRSAGVSVPTTRKILGTLHAILRHAVRKNLVAVNAAQGVEVIGTREEGTKKVIPPSKEALRLLRSVADADFELEIIFAAATGLRAGEHHALRWEHIDFAKREVTVETRVDADNLEDMPKTKAGVRVVPLGTVVVKMLQKRKLRSTWSKDDDLVFPNQSGDYVRHSHHLRHKFYPLFAKLKEQGTPVKRFKWHALRHFAVSCWIEAGFTPKTVQTFIGHATLQMTMDTYGHLFPSDDHGKAMDAIAKGLFS
jgi:integrase